jgi:hypothetical protein
LILTGLLAIGLVILVLYWANAPFYPNCPPAIKYNRTGFVLPRYDGERFNNSFAYSQCQRAIDREFQYDAYSTLTSKSPDCKRANPTQPEFCKIEEYKDCLNDSLENCKRGLVTNETVLDDPIENIFLAGFCPISMDNAFGSHNSYQKDGGFGYQVAKTFDWYDYRDLWEKHIPQADMLQKGYRTNEIDLQSCGNTLCTFHFPLSESVYDICTQNLFLPYRRHLEKYPNGLPLYIWFDPKEIFLRETCKNDPTVELLYDLVMSSFELSTIITPYGLMPDECLDLVDDGFATPQAILYECLNRFGPPTINGARGKIFFILGSYSNNINCYDQLRKIPFEQNIFFSRIDGSTTVFQEVNEIAMNDRPVRGIEVSLFPVLRVDIDRYTFQNNSLDLSLIHSHDRDVFDMYDNYTFSEFLSKKYRYLRNYLKLGGYIYESYVKGLRNATKCLLQYNIGENRTNSSLAKAAREVCFH